MKFDTLDRAYFYVDKQLLSGTIVGRSHFAPRTQREPEYCIQFLDPLGHTKTAWFLESELQK